MTDGSLIDDYINAFKAASAFDGQVVYHRELAPSEPTFGETRKAWPKAIDHLLEAMGIDRLYAHQVQSIDRVRAGIHTVVATQTASGKTLTYALPVFETVIEDPSACALFIYPLKALAQDQRKAINSMSSHLPDINLRADIYDGDTSAYRRKKIRDKPPHILMTNPEMVHLSVLPYHDRWSDLLSRIRFVVVDEVHTYRGILGSHMAQVFRRLRRMCSHYGAAPTFVFTSATVANPDELATQLTGLSVETVTQSTAGNGRRHLIMIDPAGGSLAATVMLLKAAVSRGLRTIVYTQSRKLAELLAIWAQNRSGGLADRISAYRAGFLPEERREIESRLASGDLLAVISTSALELGIDIGSLDLCILVGYPGSIVATWQRGGRVGRSGQDSAVVLVAGEDALDHYFIKNPEQLVVRQPEAAVINPYNPDVMSRHLVCAAAELPLMTGDPMLAPEPMKACLRHTIASGRLYLSADGTVCFSPMKNPHRFVDLRGSGARFAIIEAASTTPLGEIDGIRVYRETHPGAIYLHRGKSFLVESLDPEVRKVIVAPARVDFHTRVRSHKETQILEIADQKPVYGTMMTVGRLRVTEQVTGYDRIQTRTGKVLERVPLDLPPMVFETQGLWFTVPEAVTALAEKAWIHVMGGLHALEHAAIGVFPLLVLADRNDLGGISTPFHPQLESAGIFIYDGLPGGTGLCTQAFVNGNGLLDATFSTISECPCETGCPSCVHSPKCGSGNRPIDKAGAIFLLKTLISTKASPAPPFIPEPMVVEEVKATDDATRVVDSMHKVIHYGVLDIETQLSAKEVGGWHHASRMRISCVVLYDSKSDNFFEFVEGQVPMLMNHLHGLDLVIGFNIKRFDYQVLSAYTELDLRQIPTLDILEKVKDQLGYRLSLDHLASVTLDAGKTADGLDALRWWREGKMAKILEYCRSDVAITRDLYRFGRENRYLLFQNKAKHIVRLPVNW
ncbi:DEAD/DEAH box helicase [Desulfosarcina sp.]|uniref:DEAD/DEAH box helicase n=1 Tax=Desulfosarcina sp. TaxID=2027861 RepID=UPI0029ABD951|nr:DEAD/DEAH box helicase [Desulfosarcina sp.]MDX2452886.1 DEAD/DEAH box helicase [Desulfosarcina sp.]MDX2490630.1 DEAD/DEAH box helicase [Desulfosarcina sp.]